MSSDIFPYGKLFSKPIVTYVEPKNRKFVIEYERELHVVLIEKDDLIRIKAGEQLLLDGIIVQNSVTVLIFTNSSLSY